MKTKKIFRLSFIGIISLTGVLHGLHFLTGGRIPEMLLLIFRIFALSVFVWYAFRKKSLTTWILISMLAGAEFGHDLPQIAVHLQVISKVFLNLIKTVIAPLLFATLVVGIAGHSNLKQVGRMGWKSILYFEVVSTIALVIGLLAINISQAGIGVEVPIELAASGGQEFKKLTTEELILHVFPENIAKSIYEGQILQIVVFSIIFGIAVALLKDKHKDPMLRFSEGLSETMFKFTGLIMYIAPLAVFAAIAATVGHMGIDILKNLFQLLATLYIALFVFILCVFLPIMLYLKIPIKNFICAVSEPATLAFATTSSESALPRAMEAMEKFGVPRKIVAFVMPMGYSFNLDGTTLYLSLATIFVAQISGIHLDWDQQIMIVITLMLTSKGVAGVPRASLVILLGTAAQFGLPSWPIFIILGIDELMDMARSTVNLTGNCLATAVIAKWENEFDEKKARESFEEREGEGE
ncbi:MAG: sodium:dicarboxylate symporter [Bacteroidetes bacterium RIFOXYA12_FULL_35_11]|nr:MAG: sodium:dicarboxylate symporter [Bacteroidetes bacterium GWF2_35_48]OFY82898.1 MAG: sodium:dicarboxylate symporter [Bacteroidetes bacterium RIFOXYA12_FULL_35_11]OFY95314.1 MAG: sodium:dicarboxylate symporter [Bacteroidetes bacterium RIFOXYB2_FULL_35_7]OFY95797.1 MAG: sodium:dicarboxylate symporter [Bacteroidetes bacterium RIFOXYC12_FULL_35_7]HBX52791.1 dicarboxylate/amino acid:cation symporter [Bacteroidales bacterium]